MNVITYRTDRYQIIGGKRVRRFEEIDPATLPADLREVYERAIANGHVATVVWTAGDAAGRRRDGAFCDACGSGAIRLEAEGPLEGSLVDGRRCR